MAHLHSFRSLIFEASVSSSLPSPPSLFHPISCKALNILSYTYPKCSNYHDSLPIRTLFWILSNLLWIIEQLLHLVSFLPSLLSVLSSLICHMMLEVFWKLHVCCHPRLKMSNGYLWSFSHLTIPISLALL